MDATKRLVNIGSGNGLVPSGKKTLPKAMLIKFGDATWRHYRPQRVKSICLAVGDTMGDSLIKNTSAKYNSRHAREIWMIYTSVYFLDINNHLKIIYGEGN